MISLEIIEFEKGRTIMVSEPNKMWEDDVATTRSRITYKINECRCGGFVNSDNVEDAVDEIIPQIILDEFLEHDYLFEDLGLPNPEYETYDDGNGFIKDVVGFLNLRCCDVYLVDEQRVVDNLVAKGKELFEIVRI